MKVMAAEHGVDGTTRAALASEPSVQGSVAWDTPSRPRLFYLGGEAWLGDPGSGLYRLEAALPPGGTLAAWKRAELPRGRLHPAPSVAPLIVTMEGDVHRLGPSGAEHVVKTGVPMPELNLTPLQGGVMLLHARRRWVCNYRMLGADGTLLWKRRRRWHLPSDAGEWLVAAHEREVGSITGVDTASGETRWSTRVPGTSADQLLGRTGDVFWVARSAESRTTLTALHLRTGEQVWRVDLPYLLGSVLLDDTGTLHVLGVSWLQLIDVATGTVRLTASHPAGGPVLHGARLVGLTSDGRLLARTVNALYAISVVSRDDAPQPVTQLRLLLKTHEPIYDVLSEGERLFVLEQPLDKAWARLHCLQ